MLEIRITRRPDDTHHVTLVTQFHESSGVAASVGEALLLAAATIEYPVPDGLPQFLTSVRLLSAPFDARITWRP
jgi:hypothetical protein